jgi:hypothetical protein
MTTMPFSAARDPAKAEHMTRPPPLHGGAMVLSGPAASRAGPGGFFEGVLSPTSFSREFRPPKEGRRANATSTRLSLASADPS